MLDTLEYLVHETDVWLEITTLLIPGHNDSDERGRRGSRDGSSSDLGPDVPLHFTAFHPDYKMLDVPPTPPATLSRARRDRDGATACATSTPATSTTPRAAPPSARAAARPLIARDWYRLLDYQLTPDGRCRACGRAIAGRYDPVPGHFGRHSYAVRMAS